MARAKQAEAATAAEVSGKPYRVGVLFVHGMGEQESGDTVTQMGDALSEWLRRRVQSVPRQDFKIRDATLRGGQGISVGDGEQARAPSARVSVSMTDAEGRAHDWLLAESWWAGAFRQATFGELVVWAMSVGPWLIASQASGVLRRVWDEPAGSREAPWMPALRWVTSAVLVVVGAITAAVVTPLALLLLLISLLPVPGLSSVAQGLARNLAGSFGDLLVLVRSPVRFAAMTERVRDDIQLVDLLCDTVMVVAHSQGSAVSWQAIRRAAAMEEDRRPNVALFVSFGQAMKKLKALYRVSVIGGEVRRQFAILASLSSVALVVMTVSAVLAAFDLAGEEWNVVAALDGAEAHWIGLVASAFVVGMAQWLLHGLARENDDAVDRQLRGEIRQVRRAFRGFRWVDIWGSADPAPNGPLLGPDVAEDLAETVSSYKVRNTGSTLLDHSAYWSNVTEFVSAIAMLASSLAWPNPTRERTFGWLRQAIETRHDRVTMLAIARVYFFAAVVFLLIGAADRLVAWGGVVRGGLDLLPILPDDWFRSWPDWFQAAAAVALVGVLALGVWLLLLAWWSAVTRGDEDSFFVDPAARPSDLGAAAWYLAARAVPIAGVVAVAAASGGWLLGVSYALVAAIAAQAVVHVLSVGGRRLDEG